MKHINIGILGLGTVASGLVKTLQNYKSDSEHIFSTCQISKVAVRNLNRERDCEISNDLLTLDPFEVINNTDTHIIVELIGGTTLAKDLVLTALKNGKSVVTANKALIAEHGPELFDAASSNSCSLYFEAAVAGAIPVIKTLRESLAANKVAQINGILNGTCNYILWRMESAQLDFADALQEAQELGYAEADPTLDIEGIDAAHKIAILASLSLKKWYGSNTVSIQGISSISYDDIRYAEEQGYKIRLIANFTRKEGDKALISVQPTLVPVEKILSQVNDSFNAVQFKTDLADEKLLYGRGAGQLPTASAVAADLIEACQQLENPAQVVSFQSTDASDLADASETENSYYVRFYLSDKAKSFATIASILGDNQISMKHVSQEDANESGFSLVNIKTHECQAQQIENAIAQITATDLLDGSALVLPVA